MSICPWVSTPGISRPFQCLGGIWEWPERGLKPQVQKLLSSNSLVSSLLFSSFFFLFFILVLVFQDMVPRDRMDECVCAYVCAHVYMYVQKYTFVQLVLSLHLYMGSRDWTWCTKEGICSKLPYLLSPLGCQPLSRFFFNLMGNKMAAGKWPIYFNSPHPHSLLWV